VIAPLQTKPVRVEINEAEDCLSERCDAVGSRSRARRGVGDATRSSAFYHHAARPACGFERRSVGFRGIGESAGFSKVSATGAT
jgi:hypothetical protein